MTNRKFLNAVALEQVTPGPIVVAAGYTAAGIGAGLLAASDAFAPSFGFVLLGANRFNGREPTSTPGGISRWCGPRGYWRDSRSSDRSRRRASPGGAVRSSCPGDMCPARAGPRRRANTDRSRSRWGRGWDQRRHAFPLVAMLTAINLIPADGPLFVRHPPREGVTPSGEDLAAAFRDVAAASHVVPSAAIRPRQASGSRQLVRSRQEPRRGGSRGDPITAASLSALVGRRLASVEVAVENAEPQTQAGQETGRSPRSKPRGLGCYRADPVHEGEYGAYAHLGRGPVGQRPTV
jgi:hypothetical protein